MIQNGYDWFSEFPDAQDKRAHIQWHIGQATVASYKSLTGSHAMLYIEYLDDGDNAITKKIHLTAGLAGSAQAESTGSGSSASGGANEIYIDEETKEINVVSDVRKDQYYYTCYPMTRQQRAALDAAVIRFKTKVDKGRYSYRIAGGMIGRLTTRPKVRGINCADFLIKVLDEAGIAQIKSKAFNAPSRIAGR